MKIWLKTLVGEKITRSLVAENDQPFEEDTFLPLLRDTCNGLDIPTPIFSKTNYVTLHSFNSVRLKERDFVEKIDFEIMELEVLSEEVLNKNEKKVFDLKD